MITIPLSIEDLTKVRIAPSPLWETVMSFRVLLRHGRHTMHATWAIRATGAAWYRHLCAYRRDLHRVRLPVLLEPSFRLLGRYLRGGARALDGYHDLTIAPSWQRIQEHLEGDTIKRGQALAVDECCEDFRPKAP